MKAYSLGRRSKWKDYVDLYFILHIYKIEEIIDISKSIFGNLFNEKLFRQQLGYFNDIDYTEEVDFVNKSISKEEILKFLKERAVI